MKDPHSPRTSSTKVDGDISQEWAVLQGPKNQKYNTCDSSAFTWEKCWPRIAGWYGLDYSGPQPDDACTSNETRFNPRGYGPKGLARRKFKMSEWAKRDEVQKAWSELAKEHNLTQKELKDVDRVFGFLDGTLVRHSPLNFRCDVAITCVRPYADS